MFPQPKRPTSLTYSASAYAQHLTLLQQVASMMKLGYILVFILLLELVASAPVVTDSTIQSILLFEVALLEEIEDFHANKGGPLGFDTVFYLKSTDTYLTMTDSLDDYDTKERPIMHGMLDKIREQIYPSPDSNIPMVEFKIFASINVDNEHLYPVSSCHEETKGEGGSVSLLIGNSRAMSAFLSFGISPNVIIHTLELTTKITLGKLHSSADTISCESEHGEIVQLFAKGTNEIEFYVERRERTFNPVISKFTEAFESSSSSIQKLTIQSQSSEFMCVSNTMMELNCSFDSS